MPRRRIGTINLHGDHYDARITLNDGSRPWIHLPAGLTEGEARAEALAMTDLARRENWVTLSRTVPVPVAAATSYPAIVGAVLVVVRKDRGLTQRDLAEQLGVSPSLWSRIEHGGSALSVEQLGRAAAALGVRPSDVASRADLAAEQLGRRGVHVEPARIEAVGTGGRLPMSHAALCALVHEPDR